MAISANQYKYLSNMAAGKTATGGAANQGQVAWATSQLKGVTPPVGTSAPGAAPTAAPASNAIPKAASTVGAPQASTVLPGAATRSTPTPLAASAATPTANIPAAFTPNANAPGLNQQQLAYFDKTYGGFDNYLGTQNQKYNDAILRNDTDLLGRLNADSSRLGYKLTDTRRVAAEEKAKKEYDEQKARLQAQEDALRNSFSYSQGNVRDNRVLEDLQVDRSISPFTGRKGYLQAQIDRGRQIDDANAAASLQAQLAPIDQQIAGLSVSSLADQYYNEALDKDRGFALDQAQVTGQYGGQQTLAAQNQTFNQGVTMAQLTGFLPDGTATTDEQQRQLANLWTVAEQTGTIPDQLADLYGLPHGTQTQAAKQFAMSYALDERQTNASIANMNADNARQNAAASRQAQADNIDRLQQVWKNTGVAPAGLEAYGIQAGTPYPQDQQTAEYRGLSASQVLDNLRTQYTEPVYGAPDALGQQQKVGEQITTDPAKREQLFLSVIDSNLPTDTETNQVLAGLGFSKDEIQKYMKKYGGQ